jgi:hypothetical protein
MLQNIENINMDYALTAKAIRLATLLEGQLLLKPYENSLTGHEKHI